MLKAYKYRIYPNEEQKVKIDHTFGVCRFVYNLALETKMWAWQTGRVNLSSYTLQAQLTQLKKDYKWMQDVDSQALNESIMVIDNAFKGFFNGGGYPRFKSKKNKQSFLVRNGLKKIDWESQTLTIPKIASIPIVLSRPFAGNIKRITISRSPTGKYYASILVENQQSVPEKQVIRAETTIGLDVGIKSFVITSTGQAFEPNRYLKNSLNRLKCLQRRASRKKKGSNNRRKANQQVSKLHEKIANQRADYIHKITTGLVRDSQAETFVIEDLYVKGIIKNRSLSQAISDVSFGEFFRQMKYKCEWYGKNLIIIDRFAPSSKRCSGCGEVNQELTLADRSWICSCGVIHDRDINAAKNIKWFGLNNSPVANRGEPVESRRIRRAKKQEE